MMELMKLYRLAECILCFEVRDLYSTRRAVCLFFFSSRRRHTRFDCDWSSDVCSSDLVAERDWLVHFADSDKAIRSASLRQAREPDRRRASGYARQYLHHRQELEDLDRKSVV